MLFSEQSVPEPMILGDSPTRLWLSRACSARTVLLLGLAVLGCGEAPASTGPPPRVMPSQVVPSLSASLTPDGRFILPAAATNPSGEISESQAASVAQRYVRDMARSLTHSWSRDHGVDVDSHSLTPCDRAVYAANPYASLSGAKLSEVTVRMFGAHWIVPMCAGGQPQVVVSFSSLAVELLESVTATDRIVPWSRAEVRSFGVPVGTSAALFTPEGAAVRAFSSASRRVRRIPELVMNPMPHSPVLVRWRVELETPVAVRGMKSGATRNLGSVLVGFGSTFKESGLFDTDPKGEPPALNWTDAVTKEPFTLVLTNRAAASVELLARADH